MKNSFSCLSIKWRVLTRSRPRVVYFFGAINRTCKAWQWVSLLTANHISFSVTQNLFDNIYNLPRADSRSLTRIDKFGVFGKEQGDDGCHILSHALSDVLRNHKCHTCLGLYVGANIKRFTGVYLSSPPPPPPQGFANQVGLSEILDTVRCSKECHYRSARIRIRIHILVPWLCLLATSIFVIHRHTNILCMMQCINDKWLVCLNER